MEPLLFLVHRIPYPPNKGDKIRSFNLLRYLAGRYSVHLGCFVDSEDDAEHVDALRTLCAEVFAVPLNPSFARVRSLSGLVSGEALTLAYYRSGRLQKWVDEAVATHGIAKAVAFSSPMAQYLHHLPSVRTVVDLVDVDSEKWASYAGRHRWPLSFVYRREAVRLLAFEREAVLRAAAAVLVTGAEVQLFSRLAPDCSSRMHVIENGVDSTYFKPSDGFASPFQAGESPLVFTGAMDYWPNVDAVTWFAREVLPAIALRQPDVRFYIVGMNPHLSVRALASDPRIVVTGKVSDVRPYLQHSSAVVVPLRVARGVQNKALEAMSMARPVVVSSEAAAGIDATPGIDFEMAPDATGFAECVLAVLQTAYGTSMGKRARQRILAGYRWDPKLARFGALLDEATEEVAVSDCGAFTPDAALAG